MQGFQSVSGVAASEGRSPHVTELDRMIFLLPVTVVLFFFVVIVPAMFLGAFCASFVVTWRLYTAKVRNSKG